MVFTITLTQHNNGQPIDVNPANISHYKPISEGGSTVYLIAGGYERVRESVDEIRAAIRKGDAPPKKTPAGVENKSKPKPTSNKGDAPPKEDK